MKDRLKRPTNCKTPPATYGEATASGEDLENAVWLKASRSLPAAKEHSSMEEVKIEGTKEASWRVVERDVERGST